MDAANSIKNNRNKKNFMSIIKRAVAIILFAALILNVFLPVTVLAKGGGDEGKKVVRVGWHEPPYFIIDENGRKSGYSYEYQRKVAAYTGWEYEYVEGTWSGSFADVKRGQD